MGEEIVLAFSTFPDAETARRAVAEIVELRFAACGNILPQIHSVCRWEGKVESAEEALVIFKVSASHYADFQAKLRSLHPYDVPEIISCKVNAGLPEYLCWVSENSR